MSVPIVIEIVGVPVACAEGTKEGWRETANWAEGQLARRFGDAVRVEYYDLFDSRCPTMPPGAQLPLVLIEGQVLSSGGKISMPAIRKRIETLLVEQTVQCRSES